MNFRIVPVDAQTWLLEEGGVRFFLLTGTKRALLIDSGMTAAEVRSAVASLTDLPVTLINTHADRDHIGANAEFDEAWMHPSEFNNYREQGGTGAVHPVWDGEEIDLGERTVKVIHLPGHTPGGIALLDVERRILISGDPINTGNIFMFGPQRNIDAYVCGMERLAAMRGSFDTIWPSHGELPLSPDLIPGLIEGAKAILCGGVPGEKFDFMDLHVLRRKAGPGWFLCAPEE